MDIPTTPKSRGYNVSIDTSYGKGMDTGNGISGGMFRIMDQVPRYTDTSFP